MSAGPAAVALLRGINLGRRRRVAMAELRALLAGLGYPDASTYLQSGNVILRTLPAGIDGVRPDLEGALARHLDLDVTVIVRTAAELAALVAADPLRDVADDPARHLVTFLAEAPDPAPLDALDPAQVAPDRYRLCGRELHLWYATGILGSPLAALPWDRLLGGVPGTARNWRTVTRLAELVSG